MEFLKPSPGLRPPAVRPGKTVALPGTTEQGPTLDDLQDEILQLRGELQARDEDLDRYQEELAELRDQLDSALRTEAEILGSTCWRVTRPLRWLGSQKRAATTVFRAYRQSLNDGLSHREIARQAWRLFAAGAPLGRADANYLDWTRRFDELNPGRLEILGTRVRELQERPTISVVMPVYNTAEQLLREAIESVLAQIYPHWELCIADDASPGPHVRLVLDEYSRRDPRIRVSYRPENGHISRATNTAIEMARGDFVAFLDHEDLIRPHALACVAAAVNEFPDARVLYSDEDKLDARGRRCEPHFKTAFSPDLLRSHNYMCHFAVYRRHFLMSLGALRVGYEGAQDYDLVLRAVESADPGQIIHIPRVRVPLAEGWREQGREAVRRPRGLEGGQRAPGPQRACRRSS